MDIYVPNPGKPGSMWVSKVTIRTAAKAHQCASCYGSINPGTKYQDAEEGMTTHKRGPNRRFFTTHTRKCMACVENGK